MSERIGLSVLVKVPVSATPTAFSMEISGTFAGKTDAIRAVNKSATGFLTQRLTNQTWGVAVRSHLDDTTNPALDVVRDAWTNKTLLAACQFDAVTTGWTGSGDAYVDQLEVAGDASDFAVVSFNLLGTGTFTWS